MSIAFLLALQTDRWRVIRTDGDRIDCEDVAIGPGSGAEQVRAAMDRQGYRGQPVCLGLPSEMVLSAGIECDDLPRKDRRMAMLYRLEEQLPVEAERLTADFLPAAAGRALGVAVETSRIAAIVDALSEAGIEIASICPTAFCTLRGVGRQEEPVDYAVLGDSRSVEVFRMNNATPIAWYTRSSDPSEILRCLHADLLASPASDGPTVVGLAGDGVDSVLQDASDLQCIRLSQDDLLAAAARGAAQLTSGGDDWIDLRRDGLAVANPWGRLSKLLGSAAILLILLLVAMSAALLWRGRQYRALASRAESEQAAIFTELLPNRPIPPGITDRLRSELKRRSGDARADGALPARVCALDSLRRIFAHLPADVRLRITNLRIAESSLRIVGEARTHTDAGRIRQSLLAAGLAIDAPQSEKLAPRGVTFTLTGAPSGEGTP